MTKLSLEDFSDTKLSLKDFGESEPQGSRINERTAAQLSASTTLLSGGDFDQYTQSKDDIMNPESRERFLSKVDNVRGVVSDGLRNEAVSIAADENLGITDRANAFSVLQKGDELINELSTSEILADRGLAEPSLGESDESEEIRSFLIDDVEEVQARKRELTRRINELEMLQNPNMKEMSVDFAEIVAPFAEWIHYERIGQELGLPVSDFALLGTWKQAIFDHIRSLPLEDREIATDQLFKLIEETSTVVFPDGNDIVVRESLERALINNDYSNFERWFDNFTSVLDITGVGGALVRSLKAPRNIGKGLDVVNDARANISEKGSDSLARVVEGTEETREVLGLKVRSGVIPQSASQVMKDVNPEKYRKMHKLVDNDETGEAAKALHGTTRTEALSNDVLPEAGNLNSSVRNKVNIVTPEDQKALEIQKAAARTVNTDVTDVELQTIGSRLLSGFENIKGTYFHPESVKLGDDGAGNLVIVGRYSPVDSGYKTAARAIENALVEFRNYRLSEDDITLYTRQGDKWVPTNIKDVQSKATLREGFVKRKKKIPTELKELDYYIGINYKYKYAPEDLEINGILTTGNSFTRIFDSMRPSWFTRNQQGSVVQNIFDPSSVIHPQIVNAATVAVDRALGIKKLFVELFEEFTSDFKNLNKGLPRKERKARTAALNEYINKANEEGIAFNKTDLLNRGFNQEEINALEKWRRSNDVVWRASNDDMVKTLRARGFRAFVHKDSDTLLFGRPVKLKAAKEVREAYDVVDDVIKKVDVDDLYDQGGELVKFSEPQELGGRWVDHVISPNTPNGGYTRVLRDNEIVLPYRDGYYPVMYEANWFIEIAVPGSKTPKVIASSKHLEDAKHYKDQIVKSEGYDPKDVIIREDRRKQADRLDFFDEGAWNLAANTGLTSQRKRGKRLQEAGVNLHKSGRTHIRDPLEAVANQINSLSHRISMRDLLGSFKQRWLQSYGDQLDLPVDKFTGQVKFPNSIVEVKAKVGANRGLVADARTNYNYIYSLENGYINLIDEGFKGVMHDAANFFAELGWRGAEDAFFSASEMNPTQRVKIAAFKFFLSSNPIRQGLIQRGQILQIGAINPEYLARDMIPDLIGIRMAERGWTGSAKYNKLWDEIKNAGVLEAVDAHTLIRDDALRLADLTVADRVKTVGGAPIRALQKIGFDFAEQDVLLTSWLAHRDLAIKAGKNLKSQRVQDEIHGQARAYTLMMNRAGEMAYSQNTLGLLTQFLSFSHKALLQGFTNKSLSKLDKAKLIAYSSAVYGVDATLLSLVYNQIWGDKTPPNETKDMIERGLLDTTFNAVLTQMSGEEQAIDFGDFAPAEAYGFGNMFWGLINTSAGEVIVNSPGGSLFFGHNPRVTDAVKTAIRWAYEPVDYHVEGLDTTWWDVSKSFMSLFSGASNAFKSYYAFESGRKMSSTGKITDEEVTAWEAAAVLGGFRTHDEADRTDFNNAYYKARDALTRDVNIFYNEMKRQFARKGVSSQDAEYNMLALREAWVVFGPQREKVVERIRRKLESDAKAGDFTVIEGMIRMTGLLTNEELWKLINKLPEGEQRNRISELLQMREEMLDAGNE